MNKKATMVKPALRLPVKLTANENNNGPIKAVAFPENAKKP